MDDRKKTKLQSLPPNYVTLQQLQEQRLKEQQKQREAEEEEERQRQLQKEKEEEAKKERGKQLRESIRALEMQARNRPHRKNRPRKDRIPAIEGETDGQDRKIEALKNVKKKRKKKTSQGGTEATKTKPDVGVEESEGVSVRRDRSANGKISEEISVSSVEIIRKIEDLSVSAWEKRGVMDDADGTNGKPSAEGRSGSRMKKGYGWLAKTMRPTPVLEYEKGTKMDGADAMRTVENRASPGRNPGSESRGSSWRKRGLRGRRESPVRQLVVAVYEKPKELHGPDGTDESITAENLATPEAVRQGVVVDQEKQPGEVDGSDGAEKRPAVSHRGSFSKKRGDRGRRGSADRRSTAESFTAENRATPEAVRQGVVVDKEKLPGEVDGSDGAEKRPAVSNRGRLSKKRGDRGRWGSADRRSTAVIRDSVRRDEFGRRTALDLMWVRKDEIRDGAPAGFQCSSTPGR